MAFNRRKTRAENDRSGMVRRHERWTGMDSDSDPISLPEGKVPLLHNAVAYKTHVEERSGSLFYRNLNETIYGMHFHRASKRWIVHIEAGLFWMPADAASDPTPNDILRQGGISNFGTNPSTDQITTFSDFQDGVLLCLGRGGGRGLYFVDLSSASPRFYNLTAPCPVLGWNAIAPSGASITYTYRYLFTLSRIEDGATNVADRKSGGKLIHESGTRTDIVDGVDYLQVVRSASISSSSVQAVDIREDGTNRLPSVYAGESSSHWTHISVYRTLEIGAAIGTTASTGEVNDPEQYVWLHDLPISYTSFNDDIDDDTLRSRLASGDTLKSRGFVPVGASPRYDGGGSFLSEVRSFAVADSFIMATRDDEPNMLDYSQLSVPAHAGYHSPIQFKKMSQDITLIKIDKTTATIIHEKSVSGADLNAYKDAGSQSSIFILDSFYSFPQPIGVIDVTSVADVEGGAFICRCSDNSIRIWNGTSFGKDLSDSQVSGILERAMPSMSVGKFFRGAYLLWYRDDDSSTSNDKVLRYAVSEKAGVGWSYFTDYVSVGLGGVGDIMIDDDGYEKLIMQHTGDFGLYWVETYDGPDGSGIFRCLQDLALPSLSVGTPIASTVRLPDYTGELHSYDSIHQLTNIYLTNRPQVSGSEMVYDDDGFADGFRMDATGYSDGVAGDSIRGCDPSGDIEFHIPPRGSRVGVALAFAAGGWRLVRATTRIRNIDRKKTTGIVDSDTSSYLEALEDELVLWLSRGDHLDMDRVNSVRLTNLVSGYSSVTGPDGIENSAMLFDSDYNSRLQAPASILSPTAISGDYYISFWMKMVAGAAATNPVYVIEVDGSNPLSIRFNSSTEIEIPTLGITQAVSNVEDGDWHFFQIKRVSGVNTIYQNNSILATPSSSATMNIYNGPTYVGNSGLYLFDFRIYSDLPGETNSVFSLISSLYYSDIINYNGKKTLPY